MRARLQHLWTALALATCASVAIAAPADGGVSDLQNSLAGKVLGVDAAPVRIARAGVDGGPAVAALLEGPLGANAAVRIALLNNPELQVTLGSESTAISDITSREAPAKLRIRQTLTTLSATTLKAWIQAVTSAQSVEFLREAKATAHTRNELARRMVRVGNLSPLAQAQYQAALSDAALALARAEQEAFSAREKLIQLLGLWGEQTRFALPATLPALPEQVQDMPDVEARALAARADLAVARTQWDFKQRSSMPGTADDLWDAMADAARVRALAVKVRSQAREAYFNYRSTFDMAQHLQTEVLPLRKYINDELLLRYNGMLTSVFDVLADSQQQTLSANAALLAQRDFWLAHTDLQAVLAGAPREALGTNAASEASNSAGPGPAGH